MFVVWFCLLLVYSGRGEHGDESGESGEGGGSLKKSGGGAVAGRSGALEAMDDDFGIHGLEWFVCQNAAMMHRARRKAILPRSHTHPTFGLCGECCQSALTRKNRRGGMVGGFHSRLMTPLVPAPPVAAAAQFCRSLLISRA